MGFPIMYVSHMLLDLAATKSCPNASILYLPLPSPSRESGVMLPMLRYFRNIASNVSIQGTISNGEGIAATSTVTPVASSIVAMIIAILEFAKREIIAATVFRSPVEMALNVSIFQFSGSAIFLSVEAFSNKLGLGSVNTEINNQRPYCLLYVVLDSARR